MKLKTLLNKCFAVGIVIILTVDLLASADDHNTLKFDRMDTHDKA